MGIEKKLEAATAAIEALTSRLDAVGNAQHRLERLQRRIQAAKRRAEDAETYAQSVRQKAAQSAREAAEREARECVRDDLERIAVEEYGAMCREVDAFWGAFHRDADEFDRQEKMRRDAIRLQVKALMDTKAKEARAITNMESDMDTARAWLAYVNGAIAARKTELEVLDAHRDAQGAPPEQYAEIVKSKVMQAAARIIEEATQQANRIIETALSKSAPQPVTAERRIT